MGQKKSNELLYVIFHKHPFEPELEQLAAAKLADGLQQADLKLAVHS